MLKFKKKRKERLNMEFPKDISKTLAFVLIVFTVLISAASTWILIDKALSREPQLESTNSAIIKLNILEGPIEKIIETDSGTAKLVIAKSKGG